MKLELARSAGFCYGVRRAVELAEQAAAQGTPCVMLGSIIHNQAVIGRLAEQGLRSVKHRRRCRMARRSLSAPTARAARFTKRWRVGAPRSWMPPAPM